MAKKNKQSTIVYLSVRLVIEHPENIMMEDAAHQVEQECNYQFKYRKDGIQIKQTEIVEITDIVNYEQF